MVYNKANIGYIPAIALKELLAGRQVEIVGNVCINLKTVDDYHRMKKDLHGLIGEIVFWKGGTVHIATRSIVDCPDWVKDMIDQGAWDHPMMVRWQTPKGAR